MPNEVGNLFNLRFLSLRSTKVKVLPKSLASLQNLQTLDLRNCSAEKLPSGVRKLYNLRHLLISRSGKNDIWLPMQTVPREIFTLKHLQTLQRIVSNNEVVRHVGNLMQIRSLAIVEVSETDGIELCASIKRMRFLHQLYVQAIEKGEGFLELNSIDTPPPFLEKLCLRARLRAAPSGGWLDWFSSLTNLRVLILRSSGLSADPLPTFQYLPNLTHLDLRKAYNGEELCFKGDGFTSLRKLCLFDLSQLSQIKIEERAMQSLQRINLVRCVKLKTLPQGIEYLTKLQVLQLKEMPNELLESMRGQGVSHKKISRIPLVRHFTQSDGKWTLENFLQPGVFSVDKAPRIHQPS
ncbi:hypothetical protein QJS04_geneDACA007795 [Acorus gramineus]|uniref:Disease resistance R13L4/SHOC-2-like LRR domain-containing protein n=1 Tax=Acorus gramineus TaxID=55184 RepID=A0AAV9B7S7_ACOGR|nr:hypothetical protein QJS04_geneDACA007795 [Acorus gramineus]